MEDELVIDVRGLAGDVLQTRQPGEDLDESILRAAKERYADRGVAVFNAMKAALDYQAQRTGGSREDVLRNLKGPMLLKTSVSEAKSFSFGPRLGGSKPVSRSVSFVTTTRSGKDLSQSERDEMARALEEAARQLESSGPTGEPGSADAPAPVSSPAVGPTVEQHEAAKRPRSLIERLRDLLG